MVSSRLDFLCKEKDNCFEQAARGLNDMKEATQYLSQMKDEQGRFTDVCGRAGDILDSIDKDFKEKTKLTNSDIVLLFLCTAIQCVRQYLLRNDTLRFKDEVDANGKIKAHSNKKGDELMQNTIGKVTKPEWNEILFQSVPYDILKNSRHVRDIGLSGTTHRYSTLGHDPVLG